MAALAARLRPFRNERKGDIGTIGDQSVDSRIEQPAHVDGLVDGPDVHLYAEAVGERQEARTEHA